MALASARLRCLPAAAAASVTLGPPANAARAARSATGYRYQLLRRPPPPRSLAASAAVAIVPKAQAGEGPAGADSAPYELRDYQSEAIDDVLKAYHGRGVTRQLVSMPTGSGKTVIMSHLAKRLGRRTLVLAHRTELLEQTCDKARAIWPEASVGILNAQSKQFDTQVVVASVATAKMKQSLEKLAAQGFGLVIVDEAHHAPANMYVSILTRLGFQTGGDNEQLLVTSSCDTALSSTELEGQRAGSWSEGEDAAAHPAVAFRDPLLVGFTATPFRLDQQSLGKVFQELTFERDLQYMVGHGYLVPPVGHRILTEADLTDVRAPKKGDFKEAELEVYVNTPQRNALTAQAYQALAPGRPAIVFCVGVEHSLAMRDAFLEAGLTCDAIHSDLSPAERAAALQRFQSGKTQVLTNCMILTEGFDDSTVSCVVMARPTRSMGLYTQCIGRGLRLHPGKSDCMVIDLTDRHHDLSTVVSLGKLWPFTATQRFEIGCNGHGGDRTQAKIYLSSVASGELALLGPRYGWMRFGDTSHFVLNVFSPNKGGQRFFWLLACQPLHPTRSSEGGPAHMASADSSPNSSGDGGSGGKPLLYVVWLLEQRGSEFSWQPARLEGGSSRACTLQTALCQAEALIRYKYGRHHAVDWARPMTGNQKYKLGIVWGAEADLLASQQLSCGQAATLIGLKGVTSAYSEGMFEIPEFYC